MTEKTATRSGYVALIGRTNAGKSTFLNAVMGTKVSIVSDRPQTTRRQILGIKTSEKGQIIFFDSPGIHKPQFKLNERMMKDVHNSLTDTDLILYFVDMSDKRGDEFIMDLIKESGKPAVLVLNKIDKFNKGKVLEKISKMKDIHDWLEIVPLSALQGLNVDLLEELIFSHLPEGDPFYPAEEFTLQTEKFYVSEMIREKVLNLTHDELPYTTTIKVEEISEKKSLFHIRADIYVETRSQKKIVIGNKGSMIKEIGLQARTELEDYFDKKVLLELFVKIVPNWRNSNQVLGDIFE